MKNLRLLRSICAALCLAAPATGLSSGDHDRHEGHSGGGGHSEGYSHGGYRGGEHHERRYSYGFRGGYYDHGGRYFYGGGGPFFWGPSVGFSFYNSPDYYSVERDDPEYSHSAPAVRGNVSDDLGMDVQRALAERGFYRGVVDGEIGPESRAAIRAYQHSHGLEETGRIDTALLRSLRID